jgi:hypothetical protein
VDKKMAKGILDSRLEEAKKSAARNVNAAVSDFFGAHVQATVGGADESPNGG